MTTRKLLKEAHHVFERYFGISALQGIVFYGGGGIMEEKLPFIISLFVMEILNYQENAA